MGKGATEGHHERNEREENKNKITNRKKRTEEMHVEAVSQSLAQHNKRHSQRNPNEKPKWQNLDEIFIFRFSRVFRRKIVHICTRFQLIINTLFSFSAIFNCKINGETRVLRSLYPTLGSFRNSIRVSAMCYITNCHRFRPTKIFPSAGLQFVSVSRFFSFVRLLQLNFERDTGR